MDINIQRYRQGPYGSLNRHDSGDLVRVEDLEKLGFSLCPVAPVEPAPAPVESETADHAPMTELGLDADCVIAPSSQEELP